MACSIPDDRPRYYAIPKDKLNASNISEEFSEATGSKRREKEEEEENEDGLT